MCVRKKPNYVTLESNGWGWETGGGNERPEMERKTKEQWETDLLQDSCSLSGACSQHICSPFFFTPLFYISHYLVPRDGE